ncbi:MAG: type IX secretion system membrane protein PorP/SprF [Cytophagales bacterium]|nr:MAG: type IX secretion system membrane protein PorP/SprF [Cytophagales bacterium]
MKNKIKISVLLIAFVSTLKAQELPQLNSYMFNQFIYNPASGGMYDADFNASFASRIQWAGTDGAPLTGYMWADHRFRKNSMSVGILAMYETVGAKTNNEFAANFSYILRLTNKLKLSFGLRAGIASYGFDASKIVAFDSEDDLAIGYRKTYPKFGGGAQLYGRKFYVGLGLPDLGSINSNASPSDVDKNFFRKNKNFSLLGGYRFKISDGLGLFPNAKIFYFPGNNNGVRVDASLLVEITDYFWAGGNFGSLGNAALMAGTFISSRFRFMYAYEFMLKSKSISGAAFNVHEINLMVQFDDLFARKNKKVVEE